MGGGGMKIVEPSTNVFFCVLCQVWQEISSLRQRNARPAAATAWCRNHEKWIKCRQSFFFSFPITMRIKPVQCCKFRQNSMSIFFHIMHYAVISVNTFSKYVLFANKLHVRFLFRSFLLWGTISHKYLFLLFGAVLRNNQQRGTWHHLCFDKKVATND